MHKVLMISPHFPPDTSAGTHRVRLLAPHLPRYGWEPTVVTVDSEYYESRLDEGLAQLVPSDLRVIRCKAWSSRLTRKFGLGDLGFRAFSGLYRTCVELLSREKFDALFITLYPTYPALLGPILKKRFGIPFILDYQDPWVGAWGLTVGGGQGGRPDLKSRLSRKLATVLEPLAIDAADAVTAVSTRTYEEIRERIPELEMKICAEIPIGGEPADFNYLRKHPRPNAYFDPSDGNFHLCYVGTLLPLGFETLRGVLAGVAQLRECRPDLYCRLRLHFFGTSNQTAADASQRVMPVARELGVDDHVTEMAPRVDYLDALTILTQASGILMMGSSERHYTASKLFPGLLARRPILVAYHEDSSVTEILRRAARQPSARVVTYDDMNRAGSRASDISRELEALLECPGYDPRVVDLRVMEAYSAEFLAGSLAKVLSAAVRGVSGSTAALAEGGGVHEG